MGVTVLHWFDSILQFYESVFFHMVTVHGHDGISLPTMFSLITYVVFAQVGFVYMTEVVTELLCQVVSLDNST